MNVFKHLIFTIMAAVIAASCAYNDSEWKTEKLNAVRFALSVPAVATPTPSTRSLTAAQEKAVDAVDVLVFYTQGTHAGKLHSRQAGEYISENTYEVELPEGTFDLVVLGNATTILDNTTGLLPQTITKDAATASLVYTNTDRWTANNLPLWGYADGVTVNQSTSLTGSNAIDMHRMLSKIEVQLTGSSSASFQLRSVRLYNYNTKGRLAPDAYDTNKWNPTGGKVNPGKGIAKAPTLPASPGAVTGVNNPLTYTSAHGLTATGILNTIYTFEAAQGTALTPNTNPCLVIGGSYQGGSETFYRVEFINKTDKSYLHLLRNHRYLFSISRVTSEGHSTAEEAFASRSSNLDADVLQWEEGDITGLAFDGQNFLGVSQEVFELSSDAYNEASTGNRLKVRTDVPAGWTATVWADREGTVPVPNDGVTGNKWLRISPTSGTGADDTANFITLSTDKNNTGMERVAYIHVKAGKLSYIVEVKQVLPALKITDVLTGEEITSISFASRTSLIGVAPTPRQVMVEWSPASETVNISRIPGATELTWSSAYPTTLSGGAYVITINPAGITQQEVNSNPFLSKSTRLTFTLGAASITANLDIVHTHYVLNASNFTDFTTSVFSGDGTIKSNAPWKATWSVNFTTGSLTSPVNQPVTGAANTASGISFPYTAANGSDGTVKFTFSPTDTNKGFDPVTVTVNTVDLPPINNINGNGNATLTTYVGAFWRSNQTGERVIRIPSTTAIYVGKWAVQVLDYGNHFQQGDIVFLEGESENLSADAETQQVNSSKPYAMGRTVLSDTIKFRIGLTTEWNSTNPNYDPNTPVRYAKVVVSFGISQYYTRVLFIRQGEAPDYLMRPEDNNSLGTITTLWGGDATRPRPKATKFSPYNLTAPDFKASATALESVLADIQHPNAENYFTSYPTQAGAFYQWSPNYGVYAFNPAVPHSQTPANWQSSANATIFWDVVKATRETCPQGYKRTDPGFTHTDSSGDVIYSESHQSLFYNPPTGYNSNVDNSAWGYYADGFFDRHTIETQTAYNGAVANAAVRTNTSHVAYIGRLFYNPISYSSLFFPAAGYRHNTDTGYLYYPGRGYYWTSTSSGSLTAHPLLFNTTVANLTSLSRQLAMPIRCVVKNN